MFPILLHLRKLPVALIGSGNSAVCRLALLDREGASVSVFSPGPSVELEAAAGLRLARLLPDLGEIKAMRLVFVAGLDVELSAAMASLAREAGVPVNTEDRPALCDFHVPAIVKRGDLTLTVSTNGASPALAHLLRRRLEAEYDAEWEARLAAAAEWRKTWRTECVPPAEITRRTRARMVKRGWL